MPIISTKRPWDFNVPRLSALLVASLLTNSSANALDASFEGDFLTQWGVATEKINEKAWTPASQRFLGRFAQNILINSNWSVKFELRTFAEGVYSESNGYSEWLRAEDATEAKVRDAYLQYKGKSLFLRAGNQQLAWGEALGAFDSDRINPKDLRWGFARDLTDLRIPVPMITAKYLMDWVNIEAFSVLAPRFDLVALPTSRHSFLKASDFNFSSLKVLRERSKSGTEFGGKINFNGSGWDVSLYSMSYFDRSPIYKTNLAFPTSYLELQEQHKPLQTYGLLWSAEALSTAFRGEFYQHHKRNYNSIANSALSSFASDSTVFLLSMTLPSWKKLTVSVQGSKEDVAKVKAKRVSDAESALFELDSTLALLRLDYSPNSTHSLSINVSRNLTDKGQFLWAEWIYVLSGKLEFRLGTELYSGPNDSFLGKAKEASQIYVLMKSYFKG